MAAAHRYALDHAARLVRRPELLLVVLFVISRVLLHRAGVAIEHVPVNGTWQLIDPELLRGRLWESLFYLHSQPPFYNLLIGALIEAFPDPADAARALDVLYTALGLLLVLLVHRLMRGLGTGPRLSLAAAALFALSPAVLLFENYAFYTYPATVLLCLCAFLFMRTVDAFTPWRALALFVAMAALVYLRSLFQIPWLLGLVLLCVWLLPGHRRAIAFAAIVPLALVAALYAKNYVIVGHPGTSTWLGMSLAKQTTMRLPLAQRQALVAAGELSPLALERPFSVPRRYPALLAATEPTGVPVLDQQRKSGGGINFNHRVYPAVSRQYLTDALTVIERHPSVYLESLAVAHLMYFRPSADYPFLARERERIEPLVRAANLLVAGQPRYVERPGFDFGGAGEIGYAIVAGFLVCIVYGGFAAWRCARAGPRRTPADAVLAFLWLNVLYVTLVGNALEIDENQRFRMLINPLLTVMVAAWVGCRSGLLSAILRRRV